ncbi:MAG: GNAT family N-acetyltransferase [Pseudomonadota bacterium]|nr:GNAT family N-acetyltransferase [Pseudomonadota bacterium]
MTDFCYQSEAYARALHHGETANFPYAQSGWIRRPIPGSTLFDGMGTYPLMCCGDWSRLGDDLAALEGGIVSFAAVIDPLGDYDEAVLRAAFPDLLFPYKQHYTVDLTRPLAETVSKHHKYYARRALREFRVELSETPTDHAESWVSLYSELMERNQITGAAAFSPASLKAQLGVPGIQVYCAYEGETIVGIQLWVVQGSAAYYHLSASSQRGYERSVAYALVWKALENLQASGVTLANLGGGAGVNTGSAGLTEFKSGWSDGQRTAWFGGRILDRERYPLLSASTPSNTPFFPLYRAHLAG